MSKAKEYANTILKIAKVGVSQAIREYSIIENAYQAGYAQAVTDLSTENAELKEALKEIIKECEEWTLPTAEKSSKSEHDYYIEIDDLKILIQEAKELLNTEQNGK